MPNAHECRDQSHPGKPQALQHRADADNLSAALDGLVGRVAGVQVREDKDGGLAGDRTAGPFDLADRGDGGRSSWPMPSARSSGRREGPIRFSRIPIARSAGRAVRPEALPPTRPVNSAPRCGSFPSLSMSSRRHRVRQSRWSRLPATSGALGPWSRAGPVQHRSACTRSACAMPPADAFRVSSAIRHAPERAALWCRRTRSGVRLRHR